MWPYVFAAVVAVVAGLTARKSSQQVHRSVDTPTVPTGRPVIGTIEVIGKARTGLAAPLIMSPFDGERCVFWRIEIEHYVKRGKSSTWKRVDHFQSSHWISVDDGSGPIQVDLSNSSLERTDKQKISAQDLPTTLSGSSLRAIAAGKAPSFDLAEVPPDQATLFSRFVDRLGEHYDRMKPLNQLNGQFRVVETRMVENQELYVYGRSEFNETLHRAVISSAQKHDPVYVFRGHQNAAIQANRNRSGAATAVGFLAMAVAGFLAESAWLAVVAIAAGTIAILVLQAIRIRNRIVATTEQVEAGARLEDVALAKRATLVPQLQSVVQAATAHEQGVLTLLAANRPSMNFGAELNAIAERFPSLSTAPNFVDLQQRLVVIEDDLAVARGFHHDAVAIANTRRQSIPDKWFIPADLVNPQHLTP